MSYMTRMLLTEGVAAAKAGDKSSAHRHLERLFDFDPDAGEKVEAWLWLSEISDDPEEKRSYLEYVIGIEPWEPRARRGIALLNGDLDPAEMVDPDRPEGPAPPEPEDVRTRRFICPRCGGRMTYSPEHDDLRCAYCDHRAGLLELADGAAVEEQEFVVAMSTARGHRRPVATRTLTCAGCGASFVTAPTVLSLACPYCGSPQVLEERRDLIQPEGIVPMRVTQEAAQAAVREWLQKQRSAHEVGAITGLYLPVWTFDVGGEVRWRGRPMQFDHEGYVSWSALTSAPQPVVPESGSLPIFCDDVLVAASHTLPAVLMEEITGFYLKELHPFDPSYLAGWPAEIYSITAASASIVARNTAWKSAREQAVRSARAGYEAGSLRLSSHAVSVLSYKLILLPFWVARYRVEERQYVLVVNGQTGSVRGERSQHFGWLGRLMGDLFR